MAEPFLGEVKMMSFNYAPKGLGALQWAAAAHQPEPGAVLAAGDDLRRERPDDLRAAEPPGQGADPRRRRQPPGSDDRWDGAHVTAAEMPGHLHSLVADSTPAPQQDGNVPAANKRVAASRAEPLRPATSLVAMNTNDIGFTGGSQPHENMQPYTTVMFCIARSASSRPATRRPRTCLPLRRRDPDVRRQLPPERMGVLPGPEHADLRVRDPVPADRHDLRRRRPGDVQPPEPRRPSAAAYGLHVPDRADGGAVGHTHAPADPVARSCADGLHGPVFRHQPDRTPSLPTCRTRACRRRTGPPRRSERSTQLGGADGRLPATTTCSRTAA